MFFARGSSSAAVGIFDAKHVASTGDQRILEACASAEIRAIMNARELDTFEHAIEALKSAACRTPETIESIELQRSHPRLEATEWEARLVLSPIEASAPRAAANHWWRDVNEIRG